MSDQALALRLADELQAISKNPWAKHWERCLEAAAELRRLHAVNAELLEALKQHGAHHGNCDYMILLTSLPPMRKPCSCGLHAAIAKATGEKT
jgi:hypothetical protein